MKDSTGDQAAGFLGHLEPEARLGSWAEWVTLSKISEPPFLIIGDVDNFKYVCVCITTSALHALTLTGEQETIFKNCNSFCYVN